MLSVYNLPAHEIEIRFTHRSDDKTWTQQLPICEDEDRDRDRVLRQLAANDHATLSDRDFRSVTRDSGASVPVARVKAARDALNNLIGHDAEVTTGTVRDPKDNNNVIAYAEVNPLRLMEFVMSTGPNM